MPISRLRAERGVPYSADGSASSCWQDEGSTNLLTGVVAEGLVNSNLKNLSVGLCVVSATCERILLQVSGFDTGLEGHNKKKRRIKNTLWFLYMSSILNHIRRAYTSGRGTNLPKR